MKAGTATLDSRTAWVVAGAALVILSIAYGAPLLAAVALKPIAAEFGTTEATVKEQRGQVMLKMQAGSLAELVRSAGRLGIAAPHQSRVDASHPAQ